MIGSKMRDLRCAAKYNAEDTDKGNYKYITNGWNIVYYTSVKTMSECMLKYPKTA
jgi:hypothetical protein